MDINEQLAHSVTGLFLRNSSHHGYRTKSPKLDVSGNRRTNNQMPTVITTLKHYSLLVTYLQLGIIPGNIIPPITSGKSTRVKGLAHMTNHVT